eukprot:scaffold10565_cov33-Prasinocladus_malaysianus.AAC.1
MRIRVDLAGLKLFPSRPQLPHGRPEGEQITNMSTLQSFLTSFSQGKTISDQDEYASGSRVADELCKANRRRCVRQQEHNRPDDESLCDKPSILAFSPDITTASCDETTRRARAFVLPVSPAFVLR